MRGVKVMGRTTVLGDEQYKVVYNQQQDTVVLELGDTSLELNAINFMLMNEMLRKAAARLVMQTEIIVK
ncbi:MAG TPA: hypothetical protein VLM20_02870 [Methylophilaceae bacterium]|nr:hypothetical protein [Methylophilaceae bacterium]